VAVLLMHPPALGLPGTRAPEPEKSKAAGKRPGKQKAARKQPDEKKAAAKKQARGEAAG